jgi:hypothetical protein
MRNLIHTASTYHSFQTKAESRTKVFLRISAHCRFYTKTCTININKILSGQGINLLRFRSNHISLNFFVFRNFDRVSESSKYCQSARVLSFCRRFASKKAKSALKNRISYDSSLLVCQTGSNSKKLQTFRTIVLPLPSRPSSPRNFGFFATKSF